MYKKHVKPSVVNHSSYKTKFHSIKICTLFPCIHVCNNRLLEDQPTLKSQREGQIATIMHYHTQEKKKIVMLHAGLMCLGIFGYKAES